jgi:hypothetical protein
LSNAERYAKLAFEIFNRLDKRDYAGEAQTYLALGNINLYVRDFDRALRYLRTGILLVEKRNSPRLLASLYQVYGHTVWYYAARLQEDAYHDQHPEITSLYEDALIALEESIKLAKQVGNLWEVARSQLEIVQVRMMKEESYNELQVNDLLDEIWKTANEFDDELLKGYVYENRGHVGLRNKKYFEAGQEFGQAACHIGKRTGPESIRAFSRLHRILLDDPMSNEQRENLTKGVLEQLQRQDYHQSNATIALIDMCEQILALPT